MTQLTRRGGVRLASRIVGAALSIAAALALTLVSAAPAQAQKGLPSQSSAVGLSEAETIRIARLFIEAAADTAPSFSGSARVFSAEGMRRDTDGDFISANGMVTPVQIDSGDYVLQMVAAAF